MIQEFLSTIWQSHGYPCYGELRMLPTGRTPHEFGEEAKPQQTWHKLPDGISNAAMTAEHYADTYDVYFGVVPRWEAWNGSAHNTFDSIDVIWQDVDAKHYDAKPLALLALAALPQVPNIISDSGHGYHAYWLLDRPTPYPQAQAVMKSLAKRLHGDHVWDAPRILRVPDTLNHKDDPPTPVRVLRFQVVPRYRIEDFDILDEPLKRPEAMRTPNEEDDLAELIDWVSRQPEGNRNSGLYWAARRARGAGVSHELAEAVLLPAFLRACPDGEREGQQAIRSAYRR